MPLDVEKLGIPFAKSMGPDQVSAGQPDEAGLQRAKAAGIRTVINLRPPEEDPSFDTAAVVRSLGLEYLSLPIAGPGDFSLASVKRFDELLRKSAGTPTLVHCASGNRVGAMMALRARWLEQRSVDEAMAIGAASGMTRMAAQVEPILRAPVPGA